MEPLMYVALLLILISAVFKTAEVAYGSLPPSQKKYLEKKKGRTARIARSILAKPGLPLMAVTILCTAANVTAVVLAVISSPEKDLPFLTLGISAFTIILITKSLPRQIARRNPLPVVRAMAYPVLVVSRILYPFSWVIHNFSKACARTFVPAPDEHEFPDTPLSLEDKSDEGLPAAAENDIFKVLRFNKMQVRTIMTHRTDTFILDGNSSLREAFPVIVEKNFNRIPVYQDEMENIIGILHVHDVLTALKEGRTDEPVSAFISEALFVPQTKHVDDVFFLLKEKQQQMAVLLDEYGGVSGIITSEDIAEQLFGELYDEHEQNSSERIKETDEGSGTWIAAGDTPFQQLVDELDISWRHPEKVGTIAAYLMALTGSIPTEGDSIESPIGTFTITSMKGLRIENIAFHPVQDDED